MFLVECFVLFVCLLDGFNATFNHISAISWGLVLMMKETGGPGENHLIEIPTHNISGDRL